MAKLNEYQKEIIKEYKEWIEENKWDKIIKHMGDMYSSDDVRDILQFIYFNCDIDFLNYIDFIPYHMFESSQIKKFPKLPTSIIRIERYAFVDCDFEDITIPNSVKTIYEFAFRDCKYLKSFYAPGVELVRWNCFDGCENLEKITLSKDKILNFMYEGDEEWCRDDLNIVYSA